VTDRSENINETQVSIKCGEIFDSLGNYQIFKKASAPGRVNAVGLQGGLVLANCIEIHPPPCLTSRSCSF
jgi:hypothetical protein